MGCLLTGYGTVLAIWLARSADSHAFLNPQAVWVERCGDRNAGFDAHQLDQLFPQETRLAYFGDSIQGEGWRVRTTSPLSPSKISTGSMGISRSSQMPFHGSCEDELLRRMTVASACRIISSRNYYTDPPQASEEAKVAQGTFHGHVNPQAFQHPNTSTPFWPRWR